MGELFQRKTGAGTECLAPDRIMDQPHGLVRETEDYFMVADDPAEAQRRDLLRIHFQRFRNLACRAGNFRLVPEMLLDDFHIGKRRGLAQQLGRHDQEIDAERDVGGAHHARVPPQAARIIQIVIRISGDRADQHDAALAHRLAISMQGFRSGKVDYCIHRMLVKQLIERLLRNTDNGNVSIRMRLPFCTCRAPRDPAQIETRVGAEYVGHGLACLAIADEADADFLGHAKPPLLFAFQGEDTTELQWRNGQEFLLAGIIPSSVTRSGSANWGVKFAMYNRVVNTRKAGYVNYDSGDWPDGFYRALSVLAVS